MERSEPFDAWDESGDDPRDGSGDGSEDDVVDGRAGYVPAPLPAHERTWRHPSEIGQTAWMLTEPPIAIGRGLLVTTGAIGCVIGIAVLWLLIPVGAGLAPTASPTVTSSFDRIRASVVTVGAPDRTELVAPVSTRPDVETPVAPVAAPVNTVLVTRPATPDDDAVAVAVSVDGRELIVTTAHAVADNGAFSIVGTGDPANGSIVAIDGQLAYLSPPDALGVTGFTAAGSADIGEMVTVLGPQQTSVRFGSGAMTGLDATLVREGTPVIDQSGALVALCTVVDGADGSYVVLVPIGPPPADRVPVIDSTSSSTTVESSATTTTPSPLPSPSPSTAPVSTTTTTAPVRAGWAGIRFGDVDPGAAPVVAGVVEASPAAQAGLVAGDHIVAVDGAAVGRVDEVLAAIRAKAAGDTIVLTVISTAVSPTDPPSTTTTPSSSSTISSSTTSSTTTTTAGTGPTTTAPETTAPAPGERIVTIVLGVYEPAG